MRKLTEVGEVRESPGPCGVGRGVTYKTHAPVCFGVPGAWHPADAQNTLVEQVNEWMWFAVVETEAPWSGKMKEKCKPELGKTKKWSDGTQEII